MVPFAIAGVQMHVSLFDSNIPLMRQRLNELMARFPWVQMVLFSELAPFGPLPKHAVPLPGPVENEFCELAAHYGIWLIPGSLFERVGEEIYNTSLVIDPQGHLIGRYRKMFPFRPYEAHTVAGDQFLVFDVPDVGRFGVSICFDMWFPETSRTLAAMGAEVILHPSLTNTIDRDIELSIARTTAAVNQLYVFDINGVGDGGYGRSIVVGPAGTVLYEAGVGQELIPIEVDLAAVRRERETGIRGLGQVLKGFRDRKVEFSVYRKDTFDHSYLESLGPLKTPSRGSRAGLSSLGANSEMTVADANLAGTGS